ERVQVAEDDQHTRHEPEQVEPREVGRHRAPSAGPRELCPLVYGRTPSDSRPACQSPSTTAATRRHPPAASQYATPAGTRDTCTVATGHRAHRRAATHGRPARIGRSYRRYNRPATATEPRVASTAAVTKNG